MAELLLLFALSMLLLTISGLGALAQPVAAAGAAAVGGKAPVSWFCLLACVCLSTEVAQTYLLSRPTPAAQLLRPSEREPLARRQ